jgi:NDP-sugar pyrophosphorylase family protein
VPQDKVLSIEKELFPAFLQNLEGDVYGYIVNGKFIDIGVPETYEAAPNYLRNPTRGLERGGNSSLV